ncbi:MAG TPA: hypothetical protein VFV78_02575 [Vicinamibacterales bacterium]|nr:hypothetical protein [Vicinamibacterales bacterium]
MVRLSAVFAAVLVCVALSPSPKAETAQAVAPAPCRIFITEEDPASRFYTIVRREISATKKFYGSHDDSLMWELAEEADRAGMDAIVKFRETRQITMWSWASAKVTGMGVKWTTAGRSNVRSIKGQCWNVKTRKIT